ncbi:MAG: hypothetical protein JSV80_05905 [Acidobacteriota bacterium]|nr:MAG: hypothetical protein JSV80_05905 [Acidobacteriota bacterium]
MSDRRSQQVGEDAREEVWNSASTVRVLVAASRRKADVWVARTADGRTGVVKSFARKPWPIRLAGWLQISREQRFLERLRSTRLAPRILARPSRTTLVMEHLGGQPLIECTDPSTSRRMVGELTRALEKIHHMGIVHLDLRGRENAQVRDDGTLVIIDWASALYLPPGSWRHRLLFALLKSVDESARIKWKQILAPDTLTAEERQYARRFHRWRRLWPFNRKGLGESVNMLDRSR